MLSELENAFYLPDEKNPTDVQTVNVMKRELICILTTLEKIRILQHVCFLKQLCHLCLNMQMVHGSLIRLCVSVCV